MKINKKNKVTNKNDTKGILIVVKYPGNKTRKKTNLNRQ